MSTELQGLITKLDPLCRRGFEGAADSCVKQSHFTVEIEHLLSKMLDLNESELVAILKYYNFSFSTLRAELSLALEMMKRGNTRTPSLAPGILTLLRESWIISSLQMGSPLIRSGGLLLALVDHDLIRGSLIERLPTLLQIPRDALRRDLVELTKNSAEAKSAALSSPQEGSAAVAVESDTPALDQFTMDLTEEARQGRIDPIEGRDLEIGQLIDILTRRRQNNPILTGEAGVGKTAIVEGLALRIVAKDTPPSLHNVRLKSLDLGLLQAGAGGKGEFENRLKSVISEVKGAVRPIILFIDEAHTLMGAGGQAGQGDAANLLKPALARGELRTIAATTWSEYKAHIEKAPALTRRFQVVKVGEPSEVNCITMLRSIVPTLERHHCVRILDAAVQDATRLSHRYITGRQLPDKAISVLDTACARVTIAQNSTPPVLEAVVQRIRRRQEEERLLQREQRTGIDHQQRLAAIAQELLSLTRIEERIRQRWQQELASVQRIRELEEQLQILHATAENEAQCTASRALLDQERETLQQIQQGSAMLPVSVDRHIVADVISNWTGIPVGKMITDEVQAILDLRPRMERSIIGQSHALNTIANRIQTYHADLDDPCRPVGVFLLVGPSGVGKSETAITLADLLYGGEHNMITINMSEYQEAHTVSSLKGAPPGYVGYGKGGVLTEAVRRNPYSVILLDEVEKAHPDVMEVFFQVFDKGVMEDGEGIAVNFRNTLILLTSNVGDSAIVDLFEQSYPEEPDLATLQQAIRPHLLKSFSPAFLGRLVVVPYFPLGDVELYQVVRLKLDKVRKRFLENHNAQLIYDDSLVMEITRRCNESQSGARNIDHIMTETLLPTLSVEILNRIAKGASFTMVELYYNEDMELHHEFHSDPLPQHGSKRSNRAELMPIQQKSAADFESLHDLDALYEWLKSGV